MRWMDISVCPPHPFDRRNDLLHFSVTSCTLLLEQRLQLLSYYCPLCTFLRSCIYLTSLALTAICLVSSWGRWGGGGGGEDSANCSPVNWTRTNGAMMGHESGWWAVRERRGEWGREMRKRYFSLIKILFRWINPFLMCVFSAARQWKEKKNLLLCLLRQPYRPISSSLFPLSLSSWPPESLMHYVAMIIT